MNLTKEYIDGLIKKAHTAAVEKGFWESDRDIFECANLINTEVTEMVEELRSGHEIEEIYFKPENPTKPEGFPVELADYAIRCADLAGYLGPRCSDAWWLSILTCIPFIEEAVKTFVSLQEMIFSLTITGDVVFAKDQKEKITGNIILAHMIASHLSIDLPAVIEQKMAYNATRPAKHGRKF